MNDIFSTIWLMTVLTQMKRVPSFFVDKFFTNTMTFTTEEVAIDKVVKKARVAPFVNPILAGKIIETGGFETTSFKPAYIKPKFRWDPMKPLRRIAGEGIGGTLSPEQRLAAIMAADVQEGYDMINRRFEIMAAEALIDGKQTVIGDGFNAVVDFKRSSGNTFALLNAEKWDVVGADGLGTADVLTQFEDWSELLDAVGVSGKYLIMDRLAWRKLKNNKHVKEELDNQNKGSVSQIITSPTAIKDSLAEYKGMIGSFQIWVYNSSYIDPVDNSAKKLIADNTVIMTGDEFQGTRSFGAIKDLASLQAVEIFAKTIDKRNDDPSELFLLLQSAPLMVPGIVDGAVKVTVA